MTHKREKQQSINISPGIFWIIDLSNTSVKPIIINMIKKLKKNMLEELMENMAIIREQIRNPGGEVETVIKNQMEILELQRIITEMKNPLDGIMCYSV